MFLKQVTLTLIVFLKCVRIAIIPIFIMSIIAKPFKKYLVCQTYVYGWSRCSQTNSRGEVISPFKNSKQQVHLAKDFKSQAFKGLNLIVAFDSKIVPKLDLDHKRNKVFVKFEKSPKIGMEIYGA